MSFSQHFALHFHSVCPMLGRSWRCTNVLTAKAWNKINILGWLLLLCSLFVACILGGSLPFKQSPFLCTKIPNIAFLWCTLPWLHGHSCTVLPKSTLDCLTLSFLKPPAHAENIIQCHSFGTLAQRKGEWRGDLHGRAARIGRAKSQKLRKIQRHQLLEKIILNTKAAWSKY